ncbi:hypothetical protein CLOSTMETH_01496 [[Clostridium] methylpentosum DSM 5476]|uniref:Uncharacterized protein n=1 Tax=[Clostridium] methylpentosum DSM 5476 TaxID=537013 RepID=C0ECC7_9FIRM|nr:hypothetical protein CLOSTMETH_01496 [[Clostridium] methylpentosum DSM 5476]
MSDIPEPEKQRPFSPLKGRQIESLHHKRVTFARQMIYFRFRLLFILQKFVSL